MLEGEALDGFMDRFWSESDTAGDHTGPAAGKKRGAKLLHKDAEPEELEEYELPRGRRLYHTGALGKG